MAREPKVPKALQPMLATPYGQKIVTAEDLYFTERSSLPERRVGARGSKAASATSRRPNCSAQNRSSGIEQLGVRSRRLLMVIAQEPTQSLPALNRLRLAADIRITREQQDVTLALMIPLGMIMLDVFVQRPPEGALAQEDHLGQAFLFHRADPALRIGIQVRTVGRQRERFNLT